MPQRADSRLRKQLTAIAAFVGLTVVCAITATNLLTAHYDQLERVQAEADAAAAQVSKFAYSTPSAWWYQIERLEDVLTLAGHLDRSPERGYRLRVFQNDDLVLELGDMPTGPSVTRSSAVSDGFRTVGRVELVWDTTPLWLHGLVAFAVSLALALMVFIALRTLPLRALQRRDAALALARQQAKASADRADAAHHRLLEAMEAVGGGFALFDADDRLVIYNQQFPALFPAIADLIRPGASFEELVRAGVERGDTLDTAADPQAWIERRISAHRGARGTFLHRRAQGRWIVVNERALPDGGTLSSYLDITELKATEERLREQEQTLRLITEAVPVLIAYLDATERYRFINRVGEEWHARPRDSIIGKRLEEIADPRTYESLRPYVARVLAGEEVQAEMKAHYPGAVTRFVRLTYVPHICETGQIKQIKGFFSLVEDITDEHRAREMLEQSQRMDAVGQLTSGIAHDFNNILGVILGNLEVLDERLRDDSFLNALTQTALRATLRGGELTQRLLTFARKQDLEPRPVDLRALVEGAAGLFRSSLFQTIELKTDFADDLETAAVDAGQLEIALLNLIINARDAMPDGGTITIRGRNAKIERAQAQDGGNAPGGEYVLLSVSDEGSGISEDIAKHVFEPFFTTKPVGAGSGLGLSMVYGFIKQSGGHITIESAEASGTTVGLYLPLAEPALAASARTAAKGITGPGEPPHRQAG